MFRLFESFIDPTAIPERPEPPPGLVAFYWHFLRQAKGLFGGLLLVGLALALGDASVPYFVGRIVTLVTSTPPERMIDEGWPVLAALVAVVLLLRPVTLLFRGLIANQAIGPGLSNLIRWQSHYHVVRQSWGFFQNDFAGRIATKVMQTGPALRESMVQSIEAVWHILVYGVTALVLLSQADWRLAIPLGLWAVGYVCLLRWFVPRMRDRSRAASEARSHVTGRIVDSYTNILTVKLFARARDEDTYVRDSMDTLNDLFQSQMRLVTMFGVTLQLLNASLVSAVAILSVWLAAHGVIGVGTVAMAVPLSWQIVTMSGWVAFQVSAIFENVGVVQEGLATIARPLELPDRSGSGPILVERGGIAFENVTFSYGGPRRIIDDFSLDIRPGEKIGLVGRSGAGKSTLVNLLLRFFEPASGRVLIDGEDIVEATQESLRSAVSVVTQDTSLLHRSIRDNIAYGSPAASDAEIEAAVPQGRGARVHPRPHGFPRPLRLRRPCRRARRQAFGRPAPAHRDRARHPQGRADPGARRGDLGARQRGRGRDPGEPRGADGAQDRDRGRAPPFDHRAHGPAGGDGSRPDRRGRRPHRPHRPRRALRLPVAAPVRRISGRRRRAAGRGIAPAPSADTGPARRSRYSSRRPARSCSSDDSRSGT